MKNLKIGIMGGTFDPVHYGHLMIAEYAYHQFVLDKVIFVPAGAPPHKKCENYAAVADRVEMVRRAIAGNYHFDLSLLEVERQGVSYSVDSMAEFNKLFGEHSELWFICGADSVTEINTWYQPDRLVDMCRFAAAARPGFDLSKIADLPPRWQEKIDIMEVPLLDISSTDIRCRVQKKQPIKYLLPDSVLDYIDEQGLYRE